MKINALNETIGALSIVGEKGGIRVKLDGAVTDAQLLALQSGVLDVDGGYTVYSGYTKLFDHSVLLGKPGADEVADMKAALDKLGIVKETTWADAALKSIDLVKIAPEVMK